MQICKTPSETFYAASLCVCVCVCGFFLHIYNVYDFPENKSEILLPKALKCTMNFTAVGEISVYRVN